MQVRGGFFIFALCFGLFFPSPLLAQDGQKIVLQLQWEHEFQFAGYYAAQWQGLYRDQGLDVEIKSAFNDELEYSHAAMQLINGAADFAIGGIDTLIARGQGENIVVLTPVFQSSPLSIFSLEATPINTLEQLRHLRISTGSDASSRAQIQAMFLAVGIDPSIIEFVEEDASIETLQNNSADAIVSYEVSALYRARELGVTLNALYPRGYGVNFYGDVLYTTEEVIARDPELVRRFVRASLDGWRYAIQNKAEIAEKISTDLPRYKYIFDYTLDYNLQFAERIDDYLLYPLVPLGHNQIERWETAYLLLEQLGLIEQAFSVDKLLSPMKNAVQTVVNVETYALIGACLVALLVLMLFVRSVQTRWIMAIPLLFLIGEQAIELRYRALLEVEQRVNVAERLSSVRYQLESRLSNNLSLINGLAAFVASNPDFTKQEFETYAATVLEREPALINLAIAPDLVISNIYPLLGNERAVGLNYNENREQYYAVQRAVLTGSLVIAGPIELVQGGMAFVGRAPVYISDSNGERRLWGIVSAPISTASIYSESSLFDPSTGLEIAIRGRDGLGEVGDVFFGEEAVFSNSKTVTMPVVLGGGTWQLGAYELQDVVANNRSILLLRAVSVILSVLFMIAVFLRSRAKIKEEAYEQLIFRNEQFLREVETVSRVGGWRLDGEDVFTEVSAQCMQIFGVSSGAGVLTVNEVCDQYTQETANMLRLLLARAQQENHSFDTELRLERMGKGETWLHIRGEMLELRDGRRELVGAIQDVTKAKVADRLIEYQANYDALTGLANRSLLRDRLDSALVMSKRASTKLAVLFIDLDNFKSVNDNLGHDVGDEVLVEAASRIKHCIREVDTVARYSGDEFIVVLRDVYSESAVCRIVDDIVVKVGESFKLATHEVYCGASVGIAFFPDDALDSETLIIKADQAMYEVKKSGRNGWQFYTQEMQRESDKRHSLYNDLVAAVNNKELSVYYQPIYCFKEQRIVGCEALVRWSKSDGRVIPPDEFIPIAEESDLVIRIDHFVLKTARNFISAVNTQYNLNIGISVNVSARLLYMRDDSSQAWFHEIKSPSNVPIIAEITERVLVEDATTALHVLNDLSNAGIQISIDDFGTGYSGLSYLSRFPVSAFKIDRSFVDKIGKLKTEEALIETMLLMAEKLQIKVVAEGVETQEQLDFLRRLGCDYAQGYFIGKPMADEQFRQHLLGSLSEGLKL